jgi:dihydroxy-acid dehydratase
VVIDAFNRRIDIAVDAAELERRRAGWKAPDPRYTSGALAKYAKLVGSASKGAVTG